MSSENECRTLAHDILFPPLYGVVIEKFPSSMVFLDKKPQLFHFYKQFCSTEDCICNFYHEDIFFYQDIVKYIEYCNAYFTRLGKGTVVLPLYKYLISLLDKSFPMKTLYVHFVWYKRIDVPTKYGK